jgi:hypothetical protein
MVPPGSLLPALPLGTVGRSPSSISSSPCFFFFFALASLISCSVVQHLYYLSPVDAIQSYITSLVRKVEYERLFGRHKIPVGDKRKPGSRFWHNEDPEYVP